MTEIAGRSIDLTGMSEIISAFRDATAKRLELEKLTKALSGQLKPIMGDADVALVRGVPALRLIHVATRRFDETLFRDEHPALHAKYVVEGTQTRLTVVKASDVPSSDLD
jgi:hypothetical protein